MLSTSIYEALFIFLLFIIILSQNIKLLSNTERLSGTTYTSFALLAIVFCTFAFH